VLKSGDTILGSRDYDSIPHLWIALTDPNEDGNIAIVNVTDFHNHEDKTTVLKPGDHPFITKESIVLYQDARIVPAASLLNAMKNGRGCVPRESCSVEMMHKLRTGIFASDHTPNGVIEFCSDSWNTKA